MMTEVVMITLANDHLRSASSCDALHRGCFSLVALLMQYLRLVVLVGDITIFVFLVMICGGKNNC